MIFVSLYASLGALFCDQTASREVFRPSSLQSVVYHPHWTKDENDSMRDHLFQSISLAESRHANCALIVAGD